MKSSRRTEIYINDVFQFRFIIVLFLIVLAEGPLMGYGIFAAFSALAKAQAGGENYYTFYKILLLTFVPITLFNLYMGAYFSHKIAGPLYQFDQKTRNLAKGDLTSMVYLRKGDTMVEYGETYNDMVDSLRKLVTTEKAEAQKIADELRKTGMELSGSPSPEQLKTIAGKLSALSERMHSINSAFKTDIVQKTISDTRG